MKNITSYCSLRGLLLLFFLFSALPSHSSDVNGDGREGLAEAIHSLRTEPADPAEALTVLQIITDSVLEPSVLYDTPRTGNATYYLEADGTGNCMLDILPEPQYVAALNSPEYYSPAVNGETYPNATLCGAYSRVEGSNGSVIVKIVDRCPECPEGHLDLSLEAFAEIDEVGLGFVPITWQLVSIPLDSPVRFRYKAGSSQWWTAVQVQNHRNPVAKLEFLNGENWQEIPRTDYNYFLNASGLGQGYHTFRITDIFGSTLIETSTIYLDQYNPQAIDWTGVGQFPPPE
jgi:expansin (peptidoglycan-binding protein)